MQWNCHGLRARKEELILHLRKNLPNPDIICLCETFLKPTINFSIDGYNIIRLDRPGETTRGGLVTLIKSGLSYNVLTNKTKIEALPIEVVTDMGNIKIINTYIPPHTTPTKQHLSTLFTGTKTIITGDFNAFNPIWSINSPKVSNKVGLLLEDIMLEKQYVILNTGLPTYQKNTGYASALDLTFCTSNISNKCKWNTVDDTLGSDHYPSLIYINHPITYENNTTQNWMLQKANWELFKFTCETLFEEIKEPNNLESSNQNITNQADNITKQILKAAKMAIPIFNINKNIIKPIPYWSKELTKLTKERNEARSKMKETKNIDDCIKYKTLNGKTQHKIKEAAKTHWEHYCNSIDNSTKLGQVWKEAKKMNGVDNNNVMPNIKGRDGVISTDTESKSNILADQFEHNSSNNNYNNQFIVNKNIHLSDPNFDIDTSTIDQQNNENNTLLTLSELKNAIAVSDPKSSPGPDAIPYSMLKHLPEIALENILNLYNKIYKNGYIPENWKHAIITPILKPQKDSTLSSSYRPISQSSTLCKTLERIITNRLNFFLESKNKINKYQTGFRKGLSTIDQLSIIHNEIIKSMRNKGFTLAVFLDFEKAYDMVWRPGLLHKCKQLEINGNMFNFIKSFIENRTFQVKINNKLSTIRNQENGTPQGSVISSLLFLIMINDISPSSKDVLLSLFADDSVTYISGKSIPKLYTNMQQTLNKISIWCDNWGFKLSPTKTKCIIFTRTKKYYNINKFLKLNNQQIKIENSIMFLGMILDKRLNFNEHIDYILEKTKKRLNLLRNLSGTTWGATAKALLTIYKSLIRPVIEYGCIIYDTTSTRNFKKLDSIQYQSLKICCSSMSGSPLIALQNELGEMPLHLSRKRQQLIYAAKVKSSHNHPSEIVINQPIGTHFVNKPRLNMLASITEPIFCKQNWKIEKNEATKSSFGRKCNSNR